MEVTMAYRHGQNYESSVHNIKGIIKTSKVHTIYQSCTKYIKLGNLISKCAHKISTTVTRSSNMKGSGSNQSENCRSCNFQKRKSGDVSVLFWRRGCCIQLLIYSCSARIHRFLKLRDRAKNILSRISFCVFSIRLVRIYFKKCQRYFSQYCIKKLKS